MFENVTPLIIPLKGYAMHFVLSNTVSTHTCIGSDAPIRQFADYPIIRYFTSSNGRYR